MNIKLNLLFLILSFAHLSKAQTPSVELTIEFKKKGLEFWSVIEISGNGLTIERGNSQYYGQSISDTLPLGTYKIRLYSCFGETLERLVELTKKTKVSFDMRHYYKRDKSESSFFDQMVENDTVLIQCYKNMHSHWGGAYYILRKGDSFIIKSCSYSSWRFDSTLLTTNDLNIFKKIEKTSFYQKKRKDDPKDQVQYDFLYKKRLKICKGEGFCDFRYLLESGVIQR